MVATINPGPSHKRHMQGCIQDIFWGGGGGGGGGTVRRYSLWFDLILGGNSSWGESQCPPPPLYATLYAILMWVHVIVGVSISHPLGSR